LDEKLLLILIDVRDSHCVWYVHTNQLALELVEKIKKMDGYDGTISAPLMSNLAISKQFRRRGLAEELVKSAESIARKEWGYDECYLYVEKRNVPAIKLYKKMGYKTLWEDENATTLIPSADGRGIVNGKTTIVCMKKKLGGGIFG
jgi:GNAT superfamily N-acetyltransferase